MSDAFDPYFQWLGIPPQEQPPHHYRLLGIEPFQNDPRVIESAAERQLHRLKTIASGSHSRQLQDVLYAVSNAIKCLLDARQKAIYDRALSERLPGASYQPTVATQPVVQPVAQMVASASSMPPPSSPYSAPASAAVAPVHIPNYPATPQPIPGYQAPSYGPGPNFPPPLPAPRSGAKGLLLAGLVVMVVCLAWVFVGLAGWLVWSYLNEQGPPQAAAEPAEIEKPGEDPVPIVAAPPAATNVEVPVQRPVAPPPVQPPPRLVVGPKPRPSSAPTHGLRNGLAHYWSLHEMNGPRHDTVASLDLVDAYHIGFSQGIIGNCARFNGKQFLQTPSRESLQLRGDLTITVWVKFSTMSSTNGQRGAQAILGKWSAGKGQDYILSFNYLREVANQFEFVVRDTAENKHQVVYSLSETVRANQWYFVACRYDAKSRQIGISVNGGPFENLSVGPLAISDNPLYVGADHGPPWNSLQGSLGLLGIWSRLLTATEIATLYNDGRGLDVDVLPMPN